MSDQQPDAERKDEQPDAERKSDWLHLFTSSIRELYIADAVDLIAEPNGAVYRFRYESRYLDLATRTQWGSGSLVGRPIAVNFSLQHPADFHLAVFVPLRTGEVVWTDVDGDTYVVYFRLGQYLPLKDEANWPSKQRRVPVLSYSDGLKVLLGRQHHPDDGIHATLGPSPEGLVTVAADPGKGFAAIVRFLTPTLFFSPRIYWRVARVTKDLTGSDVELDEEGNLPLTAGKGYTLYLAHYQYEAPRTENLLRVVVPRAIDLVGSDELTLRSRYDVIPIRLFAPYRDDVVSGELSITTEQPAKGPTVRLSIIVSPPVSEVLSGPMLGIGGAVALALPAIFAADRLIPLRVGLAAGGALIAGLALWLRRQRGLPG